MGFFDPQQTALTVAAASVIYALYQRHNRPSLKDIPGPPNPSWIHGHQWYWEIQDAGVVEKHLLEDYGTVVRFNGPLGEERLWTADPKAIKHILNKSATVYRKPENNRELVALILDRGLAWADGDVHKRQRRAMSPAFGLVEAKGLLPYFTRSATKLAEKWQESIERGNSGESSTIDTHSWLNRATLDAIGAGAFEYDFGALDDSDNLLARTYYNLTSETEPFCHPPKAQIFIRNITRWLPGGILTWMAESGQRPSQIKLRQNRTEAHRVARRLIDLKREELRAGTSRRDVLSLLVKASSALRPEWRLDDEEIIAQVRTLLFAGHETTAKALTFSLWELARNRDVQDKLRAEVNEAWRKVEARGDGEFVANDFDDMPYLVAVAKETLRVHPTVNEIVRIASDDDIIPLSKPTVGVSGKVHNELVIPKGTIVVVSPHGYNLNRDVWGADADEWRPERWLEATENPESQVGVYGNLATFSGGVRSCIGWRFAVIEMHMFLVTLVRRFEFALPDNAPEVRRWRPGLLIPVIEGEEHKGPRLPLKVTLLKDR